MSWRNNLVKTCPAVFLSIWRKNDHAFYHPIKLGVKTGVVLYGLGWGWLPQPWHAARVTSPSFRPNPHTTLTFPVWGSLQKQQLHFRLSGGFARAPDCWGNVCCLRRHPCNVKWRQAGPWHPHPAPPRPRPLTHTARPPGHAISPAMH